MTKFEYIKSEIEDCIQHPSLRQFNAGYFTGVNNAYYELYAYTTSQWEEINRMIDEKFGIPE